MNTQVRFFFAMALMLVVLIGTNMLFPPVIPEPDAAADSLAAGAVVEGQGEAGAPTATVPTLPDQPVEQDTQGPGIPPGEEAPQEEQDPAEATVVPAAPEREVVVEGPLYRYRFSTRGAAVTSIEMLGFESFQGGGPVQIVPPEGIRPLGNRVLVVRDTLDLRGVTFTTDAPVDGVRLVEGGPAESVAFEYTHPTQPFSLTVTYTFRPDDYVVDVSGAMTRLEGAVLLTDLGSGIALNEARAADDEQMLAFVTRDTNEQIRSERMTSVDAPEVVEGPFDWVAFKSKFFVTAALAGQSELESDFFGGLLAGELVTEGNRGAGVPPQTSIAFTQVFSQDGAFGYRLYMGPQERERLLALGSQMHEVNPYGWRFLRPLIRPFTGIIVWILNFLHDSLGWGYGAVLIVFGVMMRVVLFPLHLKAMRAQLKNMAVQPLLKEIQTKYKGEPERLQQEMVKLYKEEGFNPLAGCLPMLLPWPVLVALFFVFQNSIEFRGVPFLWLPDLSAPDPLYLLPIFLAVSMFLLQWVSIRSIDDPNPQLKAMMWIMPIFMGFLFMQFASGLNLYYATANVASLPQQVWVARERKRASAKKAAEKAAKAATEKEAEAAATGGGGSGRKGKRGRSKSRKK